MTVTSKPQVNTLTCRLTSKELRDRKATIIASLRKQVLERRVLSSGYAYRFAGTDEMLDELITFVKTERACCDFFLFNLSISGDKSETWLEITGPEGAKEFIESELQL